MQVREHNAVSDQFPPNQFVVSFPESILVASREDAVQFKRRVMVQTLGSLYAQGKISGGFAAQILKCTLIEFYRLLSEYGFPVIDYDIEEQAYEAQTSYDLAHQYQNL